MANTKQPLISIHNLTREFGTHRVLDGISVNILPQELVAVIGPNGSGKTTLIRLLVGLDAPTTGYIHIDGKLPKNASNRFAYVPQRFRFDKTLPITVHEFLDLVSCKKGEHCNPISVADALREVGLDKLFGEKIGSLSGGQMQRLLVARALLHDRDILILDEPVAGVDAAGEEQLYALLSGLVKTRGITAIVVSHEMDFVSEFATRVLCLNKRLICYTTPKRALMQKNLTALYGERAKPHMH